LRSGATKETARRNLKALQRAFEELRSGYVKEGQVAIYESAHKGTLVNGFASSLGGGTVPSVEYFDGNYTVSWRGQLGAGYGNAVEVADGDARVEFMELADQLIFFDHAPRLSKVVEQSGTRLVIEATDRVHGVVNRCVIKKNTRSRLIETITSYVINGHQLVLDDEVAVRKWVEVGGKMIPAVISITRRNNKRIARYENYNKQGAIVIPKLSDLIPAGSQVNDYRSAEGVSNYRWAGKLPSEMSLSPLRPPSQNRPIIGPTVFGLGLVFLGLAAITAHRSKGGKESTGKDSKAQEVSRPPTQPTLPN
jgi:hypothetical protein